MNLVVLRGHHHKNHGTGEWDGPGYLPPLPFVREGCHHKLCLIRDAKYRTIIIGGKGRRRDGSGACGGVL